MNIPMYSIDVPYKDELEMFSLKDFFKRETSVVTCGIEDCMAIIHFVFSTTDKRNTAYEKARSNGINCYINLAPFFIDTDTLDYEGVRRLIWQEKYA